jgi:primosomal protein N' (replication factor Y)
MFVIEVIPIAKSVGTDTLSYFTSHELPLGAVVSVPLRKKTVQGIVYDSRKVEDVKSEIRNAPYSLRKLQKIKSTEFFTTEFMDAVQSAADYYATTVGAVLDILVPEYILKNIGKFKKNKKQAQVSHVQKSTRHEKYVVQGDDEERYSTWKSLIRQEFAKKKSVFFLYPTVEEASYAFNLLEKGIEGYAFLLHGSLPPKKIVETWNAIAKEKHPVAIIATGGFLTHPRTDVETFVIERESSRYYKIQRRPYLDVRHVAELLADRRGQKIFFADNFLRLETLHREEEGELVEASPFKFRSLSTAADTLVDMRQVRNQNRTSFRILSDEVEELIARTKDESEHMLILATRRGVAPSTVCGDCQNIVTCENCGAPVVLHRIQGSHNDDSKTYLLCHRCGERRSTDEHCKICGSWKLGTVGIGIDLVEEKIRDKFPGIALFKIDSDTTPDEKAVRKILDSFRSSPGSILLGTEMMLQYIHDKVESSAIISLDPLFSLPDFRIQEKMLALLLKMRTQTTRNFIVQTRKAEEKIFEYGLKGNMSDFYKDSIEERRHFSYPPFSVLIKLTLEGKKDEIVKTMEEVQTALEPHEVEVFPAFTFTPRGGYILHGLIRLPKDKWVDQDLLMKLRSLPPSVSIKVDPESLL